MNEGDFFQACKGTLQFKTDCFLQEMMCFLTWAYAHFFESNSVLTLFLQKVPNKYYLFDINKKLKMVGT